MLELAAQEGVRACFANPGISEMHLVAALDAAPSIRPVLGLFEGVATGAADGYGRMTQTPALTLLHLGPGLGNGFANLHNAYRARTPIVSRRQNTRPTTAPTTHRSPATSPRSRDLFPHGLRRPGRRRIVALRT
jgi:glyoxylate carboligase